MNTDRPARTISRLIKAIGSAPRVRILLTIGGGEACVCHLEAILGWRQAYLSQHLMALRQAKVLATRREGRFIYYRLRDPGVLDLIERTAQIAGIELAKTELPEGCACPTCAPAGERIAVEGELR